MSISNGVKRKRPNAPGRSHLMNDESGKQSHKKKKGSSRISKEELRVIDLSLAAHKLYDRWFQCASISFLRLTEYIYPFKREFLEEDWKAASSFNPTSAYSIPASSIDDITGGNSIAKDIHPAAETAWADTQTRPERTVTLTPTADRQRTDMAKRKDLQQLQSL